jgi:hypothetical protein
MFIGDASVTQLQEYGDEVECCIHIALNLLNLFIFPYFGLFRDLEELLRCKLKVARAARASLTAENTLASKEDFRPPP